MILKEFVNYFLDYKKERVKISTLDGLKINSRHLLTFFTGDKEINNILSIDIQNFLDDYHKTHADDSTKNLLHFTKSLFKFGFKFSFIDSKLNLDILEVIPKKKTYKDLIEEKEKANNIYTIQDLNNIFEQINISEEEKFIFLFGIMTGMRIGEILALTWQDINFDKRQITINKNILKNLNIIDTPKNATSIRDIFISDDLFNLLKEYQKRQNQNKLLYGSEYIKYFDSKNNKEINFLFRKENGKKIDYNVLLNSIRKIKQIDKNFHFHRLRHSFCSQYIKNGVDILFISKILGHSSINTTQKIYSHIKNNDLFEIMQKVKIL